jgi:hypothetical protein
MAGLVQENLKAVEDLLSADSEEGEDDGDADGDADGDIDVDGEIDGLMEEDMELKEGSETKSDVGSSDEE